LNETASIPDHVGRTRKEEDEVTLGAVRRMAATLDQDPEAFQRGAELPESWYVILFGPTALERTLAHDGHVMTGDFLPPLHNRRRMFGGRRVRFLQPLRIGDRVERVSKIIRAEEKRGRSGPFKLITVRHELSAGRGLAMTEEQDVVYREPHASGPPAAAVTPAQSEPHPIAPEWSRTLAPDPVLLFRYSALTFNAHRIHYDLPYTREVEGYPALVMNGGLTALLLVESARKMLPGPIAGYDARAVHPLFVGESISFNGRNAGERVELWAAGPLGTLAYQVDVLLRQNR
jgi:3-methylfumaryl-CoA hydratase